VIQAHKGSTEKNTNLLVETARATQLFGACLGRVEKTTGTIECEILQTVPGHKWFLVTRKTYNGNLGNMVGKAMSISLRRLLCLQSCSARSVTNLVSRSVVHRH